MDPYLVARFLHILFAAIWFGLTVGGRQKAIWFAHEDRHRAAPASVYLRKTAITGTLIGVATIAAGQWLMSMTGGWEAMPISIHIGATLAVVILMIGVWPIGQNWRKLTRERDRGASTATLEAIA